MNDLSEYMKFGYHPYQDGVESRLTKKVVRRIRAKLYYFIELEMKHTLRVDTLVDEFDELEEEDESSKPQARL